MGARTASDSSVRARTAAGGDGGASNHHGCKASREEESDRDIVCGRGKGCDSLPGNRCFRRIIREHAGEYSGLSRADKSRVVRRIANHLAERNMRFVKPLKKGTCAVLPRRDVNVKIGHALRDVGTVRRKRRNSSTKKFGTQKTDDDSETGHANRTCSHSQSPTDLSPIPISDIRSHDLEETAFPPALLDPNLLRGNASSSPDLTPMHHQDVSSITPERELPFRGTRQQQEQPPLGITERKDHDNDDDDDTLTPLDITTEIRWSDSLTSNDVEALLKICSERD